MIRGVITGIIPAGEIMDATIEAAKEAAKGLALDLREEHEDLIERGEAPQGTQRPNAPGYKASKKGLPPLWKTGKLKEAAAQRIREMKGIIGVDPPVGSGVAFGVTKAAGYLSIYTDLPTGYEERIQPVVDAAMAGVRTDTLPPKFGDYATHAEFRTASHRWLAAMAAARRR